MAAAAVPVVGEERYYNLGQVFRISNLINVLDLMGKDVVSFNNTFRVEENNQEFEVIDSEEPNFQFAFRCRPEIFIKGNKTGLYFNYEIILRNKHNPIEIHLFKELHVSIHLNPGYNQMHIKIGDSPSFIIYYEAVSRSFKIDDGDNIKF